MIWPPWGWGGGNAWGLGKALATASLARGVMAEQWQRTESDSALIKPLFGPWCASTAQSQGSCSSSASQDALRQARKHCRTRQDLSLESHFPGSCFCPYMSRQHFRAGHALWGRGMRQQVQAVMLQHPGGPPTLRQHHSEHLEWHPQQLIHGSGSAMGGGLWSHYCLPHSWRANSTPG